MPCYKSFVKPKSLWKKLKTTSEKPLCFSFDFEDHGSPSRVRRSRVQALNIAHVSFSDSQAEVFEADASSKRNQHGQHGTQSMNAQGVGVSCIDFGHLNNNPVSNLMDRTVSTNLLNRQNQPANFAQERPTSDWSIRGELNIKTTPTSCEDKD
jgi:hypothetical protein